MAASALNFFFFSLLTLLFFFFSPLPLCFFSSSPGMVMAIYGALARGESSEEQLENSIDGNICRCTGYRPILDTAKSFCCSSKVTDHVSGNTPISPISDAAVTPEFPSFLSEYGSRPLKIDGGNGRVWHKPMTIDTAQKLVLASGDAGKVVVGNTSVGIYKVNGPHPSWDPTIFIDVSEIPDLLLSTTTEQGVLVGGANTLRHLQDVLQQEVDAAEGEAGGKKVATFKVLIKHILKIANHHVRNVGSIAGNLMMAKTKSFASDLATILAGAGAIVTVVLPGGTRQETDVLAFLKSDIPIGTLVQSVSIPYAEEGSFYNSYKVAVRPQNSHALVNAAFFISTAPSQSAENPAVVVKDIRLVYGVVETKHAVRATEVEALLKGLELNKANCEAALRAVPFNIAIHC